MFLDDGDNKQKKQIMFFYHFLLFLRRTKGIFPLSERWYFYPPTKLLQKTTEVPATGDTTQKQKSHVYTKKITIWKRLEYKLPYKQKMSCADPREP